MKLNNSTTLVKIQAKVKELREKEYVSLMKDDYDEAAKIRKELQKLKKDLLVMLDIDGI